MAYTAVVTGASGFVASGLVSSLLQKGYNVRGTVRSIGATEKVSHLLKLAEAFPGKLKLYEADLLKEGSFDEAIKGADYVFHAASPFIRTVEDPQRDLVDPALLGTRNVVNTVAKYKDTIKRTVVTSSFAAVVSVKAGPSNGKEVYDESDWNGDSTLTDGSYMYSKTVAEKEAWKISEANNLDLVTVNPTLVIGPIISSRPDATSVQTLTDIIEGRSTSILAWLVDIRDVVGAHVAAIEVPSAKGRYIVSQSHGYDGRFVTDTLKKRFPGIQIPDGDEKPREQFVDNSKVQKELGLKLHDPAESIIDMAVTLIQRGIAKPKMV